MAFWQDIPFHIDPVAFAVGSFAVRWYAVCFVGGFGALIISLLRRARHSDTRIDADTVWDAAAIVFFGVLMGGRLGFALLYEPSLFAHPAALIWQADPVTGSFSGIRGMSFFGALVGAGIAGLIFARIKKIAFFRFADYIVPSVPIALFFGRIGNFLNLELPGRLTSVPWGVYFPNAIDGKWALRHPSQLYEAFLEGVVLYIALNMLRKRELREGTLSVLFLAGYAVVRFASEFFREPDPGSIQWFGWMTFGQALSLMLLVSAFVVHTLFLRRNREIRNIG